MEVFLLSMSILFYEILCIDCSDLYLKCPKFRRPLCSKVAKAFSNELRRAEASVNANLIILLHHQEILHNIWRHIRPAETLNEFIAA